MINLYKIIKIWFIKLIKQRWIEGELQRAYADEDAELQDSVDTERKAKFDAEMEALARAMSTLVPPGDVETAIDKMKEVMANKMLAIFRPGWYFESNLDEFSSFLNSLVDRV